jgi:hypothetical protein
MLPVFLFILALIFTLCHLITIKKWGFPQSIETLLCYIFLFNMGIMGVLAAYAHIFKGPEIAQMIGWAPGSPFQFEIGMANLSYGVLGLLAYRFRGRFWSAAAIGWSVLLLGCFIGHLIDYFAHGNAAPLNIGPFIWFNDLFLPILVLSLLYLLNWDKAVQQTPIDKQS